MFYVSNRCLNVLKQMWYNLALDVLIGLNMS